MSCSSIALTALPDEPRDQPPSSPSPAEAKTSDAITAGGTGAGIRAAAGRWTRPSTIQSEVSEAAILRSMARQPAGLCDTLRPPAHRPHHARLELLALRALADGPRVPALPAAAGDGAAAGHEPREPAGSPSDARPAITPRPAPGAAAVPSAPALAATTSAIATTSVATRPCPSATSPTSAATAGSRLISTPNVPSGQPAQRLQLERVGNRRAEDRDGEADREQAGSSRLAPPPTTPIGNRTSARRPSPARGPVRPRTPARSAPPAGCRRPRSRPRAVRTPRRARRASRACRATSSRMPPAASATQSRSLRPPRAGDRDGERPGELERHRDAQRDPVERRVEAEVHPGERQAEQDRVAKRHAGPPGQRGPPDRNQDDGGEPSPE